MDNETPFTKSTSRSKVRSYLIKHNLIPYKCAICSITDWEGQILSLHLDHINGINDDNTLSNLRFLCPNCHSLTDTYCGKNNGSNFSTSNKKVSDCVLLEAIKSSVTAVSALQKVGLAGAGNYKRVYKLAEKHGLGHIKPRTKSDYNIICAECDTKFTVTNIRDSKQKFCSEQCSKKSNRKLPLIPEEVYTVFESNDFNFSKTGRHFSVSDNSIRKYLRKHGMII